MLFALWLSVWNLLSRSSSVSYIVLGIPVIFCNLLDYIVLGLTLSKLSLNRPSSVIYLSSAARGRNCHANCSMRSCSAIRCGAMRCDAIRCVAALLRCCVGYHRFPIRSHCRSHFRSYCVDVICRCDAMRCDAMRSTLLRWSCGLSGLITVLC